VRCALFWKTSQLETNHKTPLLIGDWCLVRVLFLKCQSKGEKKMPPLRRQVVQRLMPDGASKKALF
jgi:hypothetical protein